MKRDNGTQWKIAERMAQNFVSLAATSPAMPVERIAIAGSIRRRKSFPNDIEIVLVPRFQDDKVNLFDVFCDQLLDAGRLEKRLVGKTQATRWGERTKLAIFIGETEMPMDIFSVIDPATWGVIFALRTGPGDFNKLLVTSRRWGGACPLDRKVAGGQVWFIDPNEAQLASMPSGKFVKAVMAGKVNAHTLGTPTEESFFDQLQVPYFAPVDRTLANLQAHLRKKG